MIDLRNEVTVFLISCGDINYPYAKDALMHQDCSFILKEIKNIAPMSKAFQMMIDNCTTPYYIECDEDMILKENAVSRLYEAIKESSDKIFMVCFPLWDHIFQIPYQGVKIYKYKITKNFPYKESFSCEVPQMQEIVRAGYQVEGLPLREENCLGDHQKYLDPETVYRNAKRLFEKHRLYPWMGWMAPYPQIFMERFKKEPNEINFSVLAGTIAGLTSKIENDKEKDFREYNKSPEFKTLKLSFLNKGPINLNVYTTSKCNFKCKMCKSQSLRLVHNMEDFDLNMAKETLKACPTIKTVCLAGFGEPLLCDHLEELLKYFASEQKLFTHIITNGSLILKNIDLLLRYPIKQVSVSLNAINAQEHEELTGTKTWENVMDGIKELVKRANYPTGLSFICTKQNLEQIPEFLSLAKNLGVKFVDFINILPHFDEKKFWEEVLEDNQETRDKIDTFKKLSNANLVRTWPVLISKDNCPGKCESPFTDIGVDGSGNVSGCRRIIAPCEVVPSHKIQWKDIWVSPHMTDLRLRILGFREKRKECQMCFGNWGR